MVVLTGLLSIMQEYNITDAAPYAETVNTVSRKFYALRSRISKNQDLSAEPNVCIESYEDWRKYQKHYRAWAKLP